MKYFYWLVAILFCAGAVHAVTLSNTTLNAGTSNTNVTFSVSMNADLVVVGSSYVALYNVTYSNVLCTVTSSLLNFSTPNSTTDSSSFPHCTTTKIVVSTANASSNVTVNVSTGGVTPVLPYIVYSNGTTLNITSYTFSGGVITFTVPLSSGSFTLFLNGIPAVVSTSNACSSSNAGFVLGIGFIGLLLVVVLSLGVMMVVSKFRSGENVSGVFDWITDNSTSVVVLSFILIFGIVIITAVVANC